MIIYPAIDIYQGQCVRLEQGDFAQVTFFDNDPLVLAKNYEAQGATHLHLVDLDGAEEGEFTQYKLVKKLLSETELTLQVGGGIRNRSTLEKLLDIGVHQIVLGSVAVTDQRTTKSWIKELACGDRLVLGFDIKWSEDNKLPMAWTHGWKKTSDFSLWDLLEIYSNHTNIFRVLCTSIVRDGMLEGPDFELYKQCRKRFPSMKIQASGGITTQGDLAYLKRIGVDAAIVGKALLMGKIRLEGNVN